MITGLVPLTTLIQPPAPTSGSGSGTGSTATSSSHDGSVSGTSSASQSGSSSAAPGTTALTAAEQRAVSWLQGRDRAVRAHEAAHQAAGGSLVGSASFQYEVGPDGRSYAIGGDVSVDVSIVPGDPQATITRMDQVRAAALAPTDPSAQDEMAAAEAAELALAAEQQEFEQNGQQADSTRQSQFRSQAPDASRGLPLAGTSAPGPMLAAAGTSQSGVDRQLQSRMVAAYAATIAAATSVDVSGSASPASGPAPLFA